MSTRVLMVYPKFPDTYWSFSHALPFIGKRASLPPLGLLTVAGMLPDDYDVRLVDLNVAPLPREDVESADVVFVSAMIAQKSSFEDVVRLCNECDTPVVAGGPYPTTSHERISGVDVFVLGEAELTLPRLLADLEGGRARRVYRDRGRADITRTPAPRFDLVDLSAYDSMPLQYSRGCPYDCEFCDIIELFGRVQRTKSPRAVRRRAGDGLRRGVPRARLCRRRQFRRQQEKDPGPPARGRRVAAGARVPFHVLHGGEHRPGAGRGAAGADGGGCLHDGVRGDRDPGRSHARLYREAAEPQGFGARQHTSDPAPRDGGDRRVHRRLRHRPSRHLRAAGQAHPGGGDPDRDGRPAHGAPGHAPAQASRRRGAPPRGLERKQHPRPQAQLCHADARGDLDRRLQESARGGLRAGPLFRALRRAHAAPAPHDQGRAAGDLVEHQGAASVAPEAGLLALRRGVPALSGRRSDRIGPGSSRTRSPSRSRATTFSPSRGASSKRRRWPRCSPARRSRSAEGWRA